MEYWEEIKLLRRRHDGMRQRCYNKNNDCYKNYGGRGITICNDWKDAKNFIKWAFLNGWQPELQIDRRNNNLGYCPENCRFVTSKVNCRNTRNSKRWHVRGKVFDAAIDAAKHFKISVSNLTIWCEGYNGASGKKREFSLPGCWSERLYKK